MKRSKAKIAGWSLSVLLSAFLCLGSAIPKFVDFPDKEAMFSKMGWSVDLMYVVGVVEIAIAILFLIPRTAFIAAILLSAYLGGATATHVRIGDPFLVPIVVGVIAWIALGLRDRRVFQVAFNAEVPSVNEPKT